MQVHLYLFCYDVRQDEDGVRRLRRVARACESRGQRVQKSVFEMRLTPVQLTALIDRLRRIVDERIDSLRVYHIGQPSERTVQAFGVDHAVDFEGPLIL